MITIVYGPPCSGKTTYVEQHAQSGDTIIDLDAIARDLGSPVKWMHPDEYLRQADEIVRRLIDALTPHDNAWIIRGLPDSAEREALVDRLNATAILIDPGKATCYARAIQDQRPPGTRKAIDLWYWTARGGKRRKIRRGMV